MLASIPWFYCLFVASAVLVISFIGCYGFQVFVPRHRIFESMRTHFLAMWLLPVAIFALGNAMTLFFSGLSLLSASLIGLGQLFITLNLPSAWYRFYLERSEEYPLYLYD